MARTVPSDPGQQAFAHSNEEILGVSSDPMLAKAVKTVAQSLFGLKKTLTNFILWMNYPRSRCQGLKAAPQILSLWLVLSSAAFFPSVVSHLGLRNQ